MKRTCISKGWLLSAPGTNGFVPIDLPNDYAVTQPRDPHAPGGGMNGYFGGGVGTYVKYLDLDNEARHYILDVDGAYMLTTVKFNEYTLTMHPHGYTPFLVDLTERARAGEKNKLVITTDALQPSTRWYSGAGIYRDVYLWEGGDIRIEPRDVFVTTPELDRVEVSYQLTAERAADITLRAEIVDNDGNTAAVLTLPLAVAVGEKTPAKLSFKLDSPKLWDTDNPNLYTLVTTLSESDTVLDTDTTRFGIRTISADAGQGFLLNGKPMKLRGGCIHHDHALLGAADYPAACRRKIARLKAAGFNALRIAHNPPSLGLLNVCDELGIIVMDEAFDMWSAPKNRLDYHLWFADWWARDIASMVLRDRNHPSVISYSIGNEIPESCGSSDGAEWSKRLADEIRRYDATRLVTSATWGLPAYPDWFDDDEYKKSFDARFHKYDKDGHEISWPERTADYYKPFDICGYNYLYERYAEDHKLFPERVIWGSETHAINFYKSWKAVRENSHVIGDFTWTAYDNLGEVGTGRSAWARDGKINGISIAEYPWRSCYQGDLDLCGYRRPQSYFREAVWIGGCEPKIFTTHPEHYGEGFSGTGWHWYDVLDSWTFDDRYLGKPVKCEVYTDADEVEWFINSRSLGKITPNEAIATIDVPYERGVLSVVAYKDGKECGRSSLETTGSPAAVTVSAETKTLIADRRDLCYFDITVTDDSGRRVADAKNELCAIVDGGELVGIFSGDPKNTDQYGSCICHAFEGRAIAIVRAESAGTVKLTVGGPKLVSGSDTVEAVSE